MVSVTAYYFTRDFPDIIVRDEQLEKSAGREADGRGCCIPTGERDIAWDCATAKEAYRIKARLARFRNTRVEIGS